ncbi:MAG: hypothetical protein CAF44_009205 [Nitrospira sp. CG24D]|jgi:hypothetical protein|nr:MAG: hypothetical protein CAF44_009205 [Nitrospira sp. CG24D]
MTTHATVSSHIETTDALSRLYLFLAQAMDRGLGEAGRVNGGDSELDANLAEARSAALELLSVNRVVRDKVEAECNRIRSLVEACRKGGASQMTLLEALKAERGIVKQKTMVLSDLLAVFRAA